jgi:N-acyl-D-amino-acid deacylase
MSTLLIHDVTLVDGTGADARPADVLVADGTVASVASRGALRRAPADRHVEADGLVLAPGFIDVHSHADSAPFLADADLSKISQGVTTEVIGNCGFSLAPSPVSRRTEIRRLTGRIFPDLPFDWETPAEFHQRADGHGYTVNTVPLAGHSTIRAAAMGMADRPPTDAELHAMRQFLADAVRAGAHGLSSGLIYPPGMYAQSDELVELVKCLPPGGTYATHLRSEGVNLLDGVDEALAVAARAGRRLQISHLKAAGRDAWGLVTPALDRLDEAWERGVPVSHDVYPYEANSTMLASCLPPWFHDGGHDAVLHRLRDPAALDRAEADLHVRDGTWENWVGGSGWDKVLVASTATHTDEGATLAQVAARRGCRPFEALIALLLENQLTASMSVFAMTEPDVEAALRHPRAMIGSDGLPPGTGGKPHPRLHGTFTRVLGRYVRERNTLTLPAAVAAMTSRPARAFGLIDRGVIRPGAVADLVLFDERTVADRATFTDPLLLSAGIQLVVVNGVAAFENGAHTGARTGRRLPLRPARSPLEEEIDG